MKKKTIEATIMLVAIVLTFFMPAVTLFSPVDSISTGMPETEDIFGGSFSPSKVALAPNEVLDVSFSICPTMDVPDTVIRFIMPADLVRLVEGESVWNGDVEKGETIDLKFSIAADEEVDAYVRVDVEASPEGITFSSSYYFHVTTLTEKVSPKSPGEIIASTIQVNSSTPTEESVPQSPGITIKGTMWYVNEDGGYSPMRQVKVYLMDEDWDWDEEVAWQYTNYNGEYSFTVDNDDGIGQDGRDPYVKVYSSGGAANCKTGDDDWYVVVLPKCGDNVPDGFYYDYGILVPGGYNEAWQAIDACLSERDWIYWRVSWQRPTKVTVRWPYEDWPHSHGDYIDLPSKATASWNHVTVHHEYAHSVMHALYGHFPEGWGPDPHYIFSESSGGFAMCEGWAEFMQAAVDNDPNNLADVGQNIETNDWYNYIDSGDMDGWKVEGSVASIFWDILDPKAWTTDKDYLDMGFDEIFTVIAVDQPDNMDQFWSAWNARWPGYYTSVGPLSTVYWHYGIDKDFFEPFGGLIVINAGATYTQSRIVTLTLFCSDWGSGVTHMRFSYRYPSPDWTYWQEYSTAGIYALYGDDGTKNVYVQFRDAKGQTSGVYSDDIILDTVKPTGAIVINGLFVMYTTSMSVRLYLVYGDATSGVDRVRYRNSGESWTAWTYPAGAKSWTLESGDGTKRVYYQIRDRAGWISEYYDEIILDTAAPITTISHSPGSSTVTLSATDPTSGIKKIYYRIDGGTWNTYTGPITLTGTGSHTIEGFSEDNAGNAGNRRRVTFHYLTVNTDPKGLDAPIGKGWYDEGENATVSVSTAIGYTFKYWYLDGASGTPYSYDLTTEVNMDTPHTATAKFVVCTMPDLVITEVQLPYPDPILYQGIEYKIGVTVENIGSSSAGSFNVSLELIWMKEGLIDYHGEITVSELASHENTTVYFQAGTAHITDTILTAMADCNDNVAECDEQNNRIKMKIRSRIAGDIDGDDRVGHRDFLLLAVAFGSEEGDKNYNPLADLNNDGKIDHKDLLILAGNYGKKAP